MEENKIKFICEHEDYHYFINERKLGQGSYGTVYEGERVQKTDKRDIQRIAVKEIMKNKFNEQEFSLLKNINHPNIIKMYHSYFDEKNQNEFLFMELCDSDFQMIKISTSNYLSYFNQIVEGLFCLHENKVIHRDIKPENILLSNRNIKITDFGTSKLLEKEQLTQTMKGTALFMAPEVFYEKPYQFYADIFSLGATFFYFLFKKTPYDIFFENSKGCEEVISYNFLYKNLKNFKNFNPFDFAETKSLEIPIEIKNIILECLDYDPKKRPKLKELRNRLNPLSKNQDQNFSTQQEDEKIKNKTLNDLTYFYRTKYEDLNFQHQLIEKLAKLLTENSIKLHDLNTARIIIFILLKLTLTKSRYLYRRFRKRENIFQAGKNHWEAFCELRNFSLLKNLFRDLKNKSKAELKNLNQIINLQDSLANQMDDEKLFQEFENNAKIFNENNKYFIKNYDETNSNCFSLLYFVIYGFITIISSKEESENLHKKFLKKFLGELFVDENKRRKIYDLIKECLEI